MKACLYDGTEIDCGNFKALDSGVLLTKDKKRKKVIGFVPMAELKYVVPDDFEATPDRRSDERDGTTPETPADVADGDHGGADGSTVIEFDDGGREPEPASEDDYVELTDDDTTRTDEAEATGAAASSADSSVAGEGEADTAAHEPSGSSSARSDLLALGSLGRASAERLRAAGVESLSDLAAADPADLAAAADVPPGRARRWVTAANGRVGRGTATLEDEASTGDTAESEEATDGRSSEGEDSSEPQRGDAGPTEESDA